MYQLLDSRPQQTLPEKLWNINWGLVFLLAVIAGIGFAMLYSAANGSWQPWAGKQAIRFGVALVLMLGVALVDLRFWLRYASAYIFYGVAGGDRQPALAHSAGAACAWAGDPRVEAARSRHGDDADPGRRRHVLPGRGALVEIRHRHRRRRERGAHRVALPARLPEEPHLYVPRSGERPLVRRLPQPAVEDRHRLRRLLRQGLHPRQPSASLLPAGEADRFHLHHDGGGMGAHGRAVAARALYPGLRLW